MPSAADVAAVPGPEDTIRLHDQIVEENEFDLGPHKSLGYALASLSPNAEFIVRGHRGLYPFDRPQTCTEMAERMGVSAPFVEGKLADTYRTLQNGTYSNHKRLSENVPLEAIGYIANNPIGHADGKYLRMLMQLRGVPPFKKPELVETMATQYGIGSETVRRYIKRGLELVVPLFDPAAVPTRSPEQLTRKQHLDQLLKARDIGIYAAMLCAFYPDGTRMQWRRIVRRDLERAAELRGQVRVRPVMRPGQPSFTGDTPWQGSPLLAAKRGFNRALDTRRGHDKLLAEIIMHTVRLRPEDIADLQIIIAEGKSAEKQLATENVLLVFHTARKLCEKYGLKKVNRGLVAAGYEGLVHAARRFDGEVGCTFSTYASKTIAGYILDEWLKQSADYFNLSPNALKSIRRINAAQEKILHEHGGMPQNIDELVAARLGWSRKRVIGYRQLWYKANQTIPLNQSNSENDSALIGNLEVIDQTYDDREHAAHLRHAFMTVFTALAIDKTDTDILVRLFGVGCDIQPEAEIATELKLSVPEVKRRAKRTQAIIAQSDAAHKILAGFVRREP